jgi:hypothetical protein
LQLPLPSHALAGPTQVPAGTLSSANRGNDAQVPALPVQAWHGPQLSTQHRPSTQVAVPPHSVFEAHSAPGGFLLATSGGESGCS